MSFREDFEVYSLFSKKIKELEDLSMSVLRAQDYDQKLRDELDSALGTLNVIYGRINASIVDTRKDAEKRGMRLLSALCGQYDLSIDKAINHENNRFRFALWRYESELEGLRKLGYDHERAQQILKDTPKPDVDLHRRKIAVINDERRKITQFMGDFPRYDMSLLNGTRFEGWTLETNNFVDPVTCGKQINYHDDGLRNVSETREIELDSYGLIAKALGETQQSESLAEVR